MSCEVFELQRGILLTSGRTATQISLNNKGKLLTQIILKKKEFQLFKFSMLRKTNLKILFGVTPITFSFYSLLVFVFCDEMTNDSNHVILNTSNFT